LIVRAATREPGSLLTHPPQRRQSALPESDIMTETAAAPPSKKHAHARSVIIRPWPKVVFLYPTFLCSMVCWLVAMFREDGAAGIGSLGNAFMIVFALNILVFSFDFSRIKSITLVVTAIALIFGIGWANTQWGWFEGIRTTLGKIDIRANTQFFGFMSALFAFIFLMVFINSRFNYYEVNHREILHHHGYLGDIKRLPTTGLQVTKEIYDLLEFLLLRSGRLIFYPSSSRDAVVIDNVINVNGVENSIKDLLSVVAVREME
jgi:hypothetical protein